MISDCLSVAMQELDYYLDNPLYSGVYEGELRRRLENLREAMKVLRVELDGPNTTQS